MIRAKQSSKESKHSKKTNKLDIVLIIVAIFLLIFTSVMIWLFYYFQQVPDALILSVFGACTGELSICGWIKNVKEKLKEESEEETNDE